MTLITFQDGKPVLRDGKVGTEQACCCTVPCTCNTCEAHIYVNGVEVPVNNPFGYTPLSECNECAINSVSPSQGWADIPCTETPPWTTACEDVLGEALRPCVGDDEFNPDVADFCTSIECNYRAAACYVCENDQPTVRIHYVAVYVVSYVSCAGGSNAITVFARFWYRDYALPSLPPCDGPAVELEQVGDDVDLDNDSCFSPGYSSDEMCGCDLTASMLCVGPDFP